MGIHKFKILSIDGGGIKGIIPCTILTYIERRTGFRTSKLFDILVGTSTGGIIALGLARADIYGATTYWAEDLLNLYIRDGKHIFSRRSNDFVSWIGSLVGKGLFDRNYDVAQFERILSETFSESRLTDCVTNVLITSYALQEEKPFYFSTRLARENTAEDFLLREIARATSAAPTFFRPKRVAVGEAERVALVDGGVFANNPSILAYAEAKEIWKVRNIPIEVTLPSNLDPTAKTFGAFVHPDDKDFPFFCLSLGCGQCATTIDFSRVDDWRASAWIKPLLTNVFMQSASESADYAMQHLLPPFEDGTKRYVRLNLHLPEVNSQMDGTSDENLAGLIAIADKYVNDNRKTLDAICDILCG